MSKKNRTHQIIVVDGQRVEVNIDTAQSCTREAGFKARAYVWLTDKVNILVDLEQRVTGERYEKARRNAERGLLMRVLAELGTPSKATYSKTCGCGCGCSPGFILENAPRGQELFITVLK